MTSREYLSQLEHHLRKLHEDERAEAIAYYTEYFEEAGPERESEIIDSLGSPKRLAQEIRSETAIRQMNEGKPKIKKGMSAVWLTVLGVFAAPIALPIAIALFAVLLSVLICIFATFLSLFAAAFACIVSGVAAFIVSFPLMFQSFPTAMFYMGGGLVAAAIGFAMGYGVYKLSQPVLRGMANMFSRMFGRKLKLTPETQELIVPAGESTDEPGTAEDSDKKPSKFNLKIIAIICAGVFTLGMIIGVTGFINGGMQSVSFWPNGVKVIDNSISGEVVKVNETYDTGNINTVKIDVSFMDTVTVIKGEKFSVEGENLKDLGGIKAELKNGVLDIKNSESKSVFGGVINFGIGTTINKSNSGHVTVTIPKDTSLRKIDITNDLGNIDLSEINADEIYIDQSSGKLKASDITADKFTVNNDLGDLDLQKIKTGTAKLVLNSGKVSIEDLEATDLEINSDLGNVDMKNIVANMLKIEADSGKISGDNLKTSGLDISCSLGTIEISGLFKGDSNITSNSGEVNVKGLITGFLDIESDMGKVNCELDNKKDNINLDLQTDLGKVTVDGDSYGSGATTISNAKDTLKVKADAGAIDVKFRK